MFLVVYGFLYMHVPVCEYLSLCFLLIFFPYISLTIHVCLCVYVYIYKCRCIKIFVREYACCSTYFLLYSFFRLHLCLSQSFYLCLSVALLPLALYIFIYTWISVRFSALARNSKWPTLRLIRYVLYLLTKDLGYLICMMILKTTF